MRVGVVIGSPGLLLKVAKVFFFFEGIQIDHRKVAGSA